MATWQFDLYLVPQGKVPRGTQRVRAEDFESEDWWRGYTLPQESLDAATNGLTRLAQWTPAIQSWGADDGNRLDVFIGESGVDEVRIRIDARSLDTGFLRRVIALAHNADGVFISADMQVVPPLATEVSAAVRDSDAWRFVQNPSAFFDRLDDED